MKRRRESHKPTSDLQALPKTRVTVQALAAVAFVFAIFAGLMFGCTSLGAGCERAVHDLFKFLSVLARAFT